MNVIFLTLSRINDISKRGIYEDLMRKFIDEGHNLFVITPAERRYKENTKIFKNNNITILKIKTLNIQKTNIFEKGIGTLLIEYQYLHAIKKYFPNECFNLVLYSTPPITFIKVISYIKHKNKAVSYLLLKDIFPQNAVDLGMIKKSGILFRYFRKKEKKLYSVSDYIGCMSPANVDYMRKNNPQISNSKIEVNPNSIEHIETFIDRDQKLAIRHKYQIPEKAIIFIYGGNLGKPQGIAFLIEVLYAHLERVDIFFVIVGSGTKYLHLETWFKQKLPKNALLISELPKQDFDMLIQSCDVGLIFLDRRFTVPNFPSRLLSYLENKLPVIAATDKNTDLGRIIMENGFGLWSESGDLQALKENINLLTTNKSEIIEMGNKGFQFLLNNYTVSDSYSKIVSHCTHV